jgi:hypothetical protein
MFFYLIDLLEIGQHFSLKDKRNNYKETRLKGMGPFSESFL